VARELRAAAAAAPIVMLTAKAADEEQIAGLELGSDDYVIKPSIPRERAVMVRGEAAGLTPTEWGILVALATVPGRVYSRYELINRLRGYEFAGYERTVDSHVKNLRRKIGDDPSDPRIVQIALGRRVPARSGPR
jgi:DNA-binding response OmpR family regulator